MGHVVKSFGRVVPAVALEAHARAQALLAEAEREAASLVAEARSEAAGIREGARQEGEAEGHARAEVAFVDVQLAAHREAERIRAAAVSDAQALAARMAHKIIGRAVELDPHAMAEIAAMALTAARARAGVLVLRAHPDDLAALEAERPALAARLAKAVELRLVADVTVGRHGCVVESPAGRLDARLDTQLAALERAAFGAVGGAMVAPGEAVSPGGRDV